MSAPEQESQDRYAAACHAMQTGVAMTMERNGGVGGDTSPKHLRVGVNSALVTDTALAKLLIGKGIITRAEYFESLADEMEAEVQRYRAELGLPDNVTLA